MLQKNLLGRILLAVAFFPPIFASATSVDALKNLDISLAAGSTWSRADNANLQLSSDEADFNRVAHVTKSATYRLGVGYHCFADQLSRRKFFNDLLVQINWDHNSATIAGFVWDNGSPNMQNQSFRAPFTSSRLMLDIKPSLFTFYHTSFYPLAGLGLAWNQISYADTPIDPATPGWAAAGVQLPQASNKSVAYDLGGGLRTQVSKHLSASLEYVNTYLGRMAPNAQSVSEQSIIKPPVFPVRSQTVFLGFSWTF
jgi:opacity protein-like surface antigen